VAITCPSCRHSIEVPPDVDPQSVKCANCGARVPGAAEPTSVTTFTPQATAGETPGTRPSASAITALVCSLIFFIPLVTQVLGLAFGVYALTRRSAKDRARGAAWAGIVLSLLIGAGWTLLLVNFSTTLTGGFRGTPYGGYWRGPTGHRETNECIARRTKIQSALEALDPALAAYRRDMGRWPQRLDDLTPTYLRESILDSIDRDRTPTAARLVTFLADLDPAHDSLDKVVAYSVRLDCDDFGEKLNQPQRIVLLLGGQVATRDAATVNRELTDRGHPPTDEQGDAPMALTIDTPAFDHHARVPVRYTGDGDDVSPPLAWSGLPDGTKELALICDDPDAPTPQPWVHWLLYKIPADATGLPENVPGLERLTQPAGALQGKNSWGRIGYGGPAPPRGHGLHHYHFTVYALDAILDAQPGLDKKQLLSAMQEHILGQGEIIGTYQR